MKVNILLTKKRLMRRLQLRSPWEQTYIKQLVKTFVRHKKNTSVTIIDAIKCLTRLKWVKKCFWRIKEGWTEKVCCDVHTARFLKYVWPFYNIIHERVKWFGPFTVHSILNKTLYSLINKDRTLIKTKYNVSLLKSYLDSDEQKLHVMKTLLPVQPTNNHMILKMSILQV